MKTTKQNPDLKMLTGTKNDTAKGKPTSGSKKAQQNIAKAIKK